MPREIIRACVSVLLTACLFFAAGCDQTRPVYAVDNNPVPPATPALTVGQIGQKITQAATARGWPVSRERPGRLEARPAFRKHTATVKIEYSATDDGISLDQAENLEHGDGRIHRAYNRYVRILESDINRALARRGSN